MSITTIDFETTYDSDYTLSKMTTEEYINDPRFEVIGVSVKQDDHPAEWASGTHDELAQFLRRFDWGSSALLAHNTLFDGSILKWKFDISPAFYLDTLSMSRPLHGWEVGGSLAKLVSFYGLGVKGNEVINAKGMRRCDFSPDVLSRYGDYCINDTELTYKLFEKLAPEIPQEELELIHLTLLMFIRPLLELDEDLLVHRLSQIQQEKEELLAGLKNHLGCSTTEEVRARLCSNPQFAKILEDLGVPLPMKVSKKTGKDAFAFAKTDLGFIALEEHPSPLVQQICSVRLGTKSTIEESRTKSFLEISGRNQGKLPVPLKYVGTPTLRWAGMDEINLQNLPSRDKDKRHLKRSIKAPKGYLILNADSSQVEARCGAWWAGETWMVEAFRENRDVYSEFATEVYGYPVNKALPTERFVGKESILSLQYGTGPVKLQHSLETKGDVKLSEAECKRVVWAYRSKNSKIPELWKQGDQVLKNLMSWPSDAWSFYLGCHEIAPLTPYGIRLPNGFYIRYPGIRLARDKTGQPRMIYDSRKGPTAVWGGVVMANVNSALARIIVAEQLRVIAEHYPLCLSVHDSGLFLVKDSQAEVDRAKELIYSVMRTPPAWAKGLPLNCEIGVGKNYGDLET